jgi:hypothetical protein
LDIAHLCYQESEKPVKLDESFDTYALLFKQAVTDGDEYINSHVEKGILNQHRVLQGWCWVLSQAFLFNYSYFCKEMYLKLSKLGTLSFTVNDLLSKVGLNDEESPKLFTQCVQYDLSSESIPDFECVLMDIKTVIPISTCLVDRPIQEK